MAKYSQKQGGKEVGQAAVYAEPHSMSGGAPKEAYPRRSGAQTMNTMDISVGTISKRINDEVKNDGVKIRGTGAATKGLKARGPMA